MSRSVTRRRMLAAISTVPVLAVTRSSLLAEQPLVSPGTIDARLAALDARSGGRLGVAILDTGNGARHGHRVTERFAMCSTFKFLAAAAVLAKVDRGEEKLDRRIIFAQSDIVAASPATSSHRSTASATSTAPRSRTAPSPCRRAGRRPTPPGPP